MKKRALSLPLRLLCLLVFVLAGCTSPYTPAPQILPSHIKKIYVRPFVNNTTQYGLEEKLTLRVVDELLRDGRLILVNNEADADGILAGEIEKYILQPLTYDENMVVEQYKLWVILNVHFIDKANNVILWSEPNLEGIQIFYDATRPGRQDRGRSPGNDMGQSVARYHKKDHRRVWIGFRRIR